MQAMRRLTIVLLVLAVAAMTGCTTYDTLYRPSHEKVAAQRDTALWIVTYPVNRVLDLLDVVTVSVGAGAGIYADVHITRAVQVGGGGGIVGLEFGWWPRTLGVLQGKVLAGHFGPWSSWTEDYVVVGTRAETGKGQIVQCGANAPCDPAFQGHKDYWGIGARAIAGPVSGELEVHPVEILDLITGFFFWDFQRDDIGNCPG
jgi:hypothetical protein